VNFDKPSILDCTQGAGDGRRVGSCPPTRIAFRKSRVDVSPAPFWAATGLEASLVRKPLALIEAGCRRTVGSDRQVSSRADTSLKETEGQNRRRLKMRNINQKDWRPRRVPPTDLKGLLAPWVSNVEEALKRRVRRFMGGYRLAQEGSHT
jgi:hypothetical protein